MKNRCEICKKTDLFSVLKLGKHPLCDDLIKVGNKKKNKLYKIEILFCKKCVTAYQKFQVKKEILFPSSYHYRAKFTNDVIKGMKNLTNECENIVGNLKNKVVLDIGCNDGSLLDFFRKKKCTTIGIEPTNAYIEAKRKGHEVYSNYFDSNVIEKIKKKYKTIDVITFTNVFAHIEDLQRLIINLKKLISETTILIIENHYLGAVIERKQFDTFYHEHPRTYSFTSFFKISKLLGMNILDCTFPKRYGGNIRVVFCRSIKQKNNFSKLMRNELFLFKKLLKLKGNIKIWRKNSREKILYLVKKYGPLPAKAFPGRAAILLKILNLNEKNIKSIYEKKDSHKIGFYAPGTRIPIKSDIFLKKIDKKIPIINLAWHIKDEIKNYLYKQNIRNKILNIVNERDFKR